MNMMYVLNKMKLSAVAIMLSATGVAQNVATVPDTLAVTLDQCIAIALDDNPTVKVADMEIERVDYAKKETLGQLLPSINFGGNYNRMIAKQVAYMNMSGLGSLGKPGADEGTEGSEPQSRASSKSSGGGIKMGLDNSYQVGFNASLPLIAPQLWAALKLSDSQILQNVEAARASRLSLVNQVKSAYFTLLLTHDSYDVIRESYDNAVLTHSIYEKRFAVGTASEYDVLRTSVQVKNIEPELLQAEIAIKQAALQLTILMGMDTSVALAPATRLVDYESGMYGTAPDADGNIEGNSDLRKLDLQTRTLEQALKVQKMSWYPTLALTAGYNWTSSSNGNPLRNFRWNPYSVVGLTLSFPIFEGGQRWSRIKQARIQVDEMAWQRDNLERSVRMQVDLAKDNIRKNVRQIASNSEGVRQAVKAHSIMEKSFEIGAASYLDLRDADLALTQARLVYYQAIYNYLVANSELELLLGNADLTRYSQK